MADLRLKLVVDGDARGAHGALGGLVDGLGKIGLAAMGAGAILGGAASVVKGLVGDFVEAQKVSAQTASVLASTGGAAGLMASDITALSDSLSKVTPFEDELISKTQNMLLTFTNVGKDVFPQATEAALNMATALGEDPVNAAMRLGKALNDPIGGVTALRRVGVQLSDEQEALVKSLVKTGDVAGAQAVILRELETEFGNSARAAGETFAGKLTILHTQLGNVREALGAPLIGALSLVLNQLTPVITAFGEWLPGALEEAGEAFAPVGELLERVVGIVETSIEAIRLLFTGDFAAALDTVSGVVETTGADLQSKLGEWVQAFVGWIGDAMPPMLEKAGELGQGLLTWIGEQLPGLGAKLFEWAGAFWGWITEARIRLIEELGPLVARFYAWIGEQAPPILKTFISEWVPAFIEWIAGTAIPELVKALAGLLVAIVKFVIDVGPEILKAFVAIGVAVVEGILLGIGNLAGKLMDRLKGLAGEAVEATVKAIRGGSPSEEFAEKVGAPIVEGIIQGIIEKKPELLAEMFKLARDALEAAGEGNAAMGRLSDFVFAEAAKRVAPAAAWNWGIVPGSLLAGSSVLIEEAKKAGRTALDGFRKALLDANLATEWSEKFGDAGSRAVGALVEAVQTGAPGAGSKVGNALQIVIDLARKANVPEWVSMAKALIEAWERAIVEKTPEAIEAAQALLAQIAAQTKAASTAAGTAAGEAFVSAQAAVMAKVVARGGDPIVTGFHGAGSAAPTYFTPAMPYYDPKSGTYHAQHGVTNFGGGWLMVGEAGPELLHAPRGTDVYPHGTAPATPAVAPVTVNVTVQGNLIGEGGMRQLTDIISWELTSQIKTYAALGLVYGG